MSQAVDAVPDMTDEAFQLRHTALRNANYHLARRRWLEGVSRCFNLLVILGGTGTAAEVVRGSDFGALLLGATIALIGALQLVFDFSGRARLHETLQRRYFELMADIECALDPQQADCANWRAKLTRIAGDEPPVMRALDAVADNQATGALLGATKPRLQISRWEHFSRNFCAHENKTFPTNRDWETD
ncbi:hypothetical protein [Georhizobium profundi]|nr:hypothetical protein [Georhizobium profundi]